MTTVAQPLAIFAFGLVITGIVVMGILRARETEERAKKALSHGGNDRAS